MRAGVPLQALALEALNSPQRDVSAEGTSGRLGCMKGMGRRHVAPLAVVAAVAALVTPAAEAKFKVSIALEPAQPIARQPVRMTIRTEIVLPKRESVSLIAVGPWKEQSGVRVR
jgi:hypothetical protein